VFGFCIAIWMVPFGHIWDWELGIREGMGIRSEFDGCMDEVVTLLSWKLLAGFRFFLYSSNKPSFVGSVFSCHASFVSWRTLTV
jgi:hypothetical protein